MGFVVLLFILETMWRGINNHVDLEDMATTAVDKVVEEAGRRKSIFMDDMKRRRSVVADDLKSKPI